MAASSSADGGKVRIIGPVTAVSSFKEGGWAILTVEDPNNPKYNRLHGNTGKRRKEDLLGMFVDVVVLKDSHRYGAYKMATFPKLTSLAPVSGNCEQEESGEEREERLHRSIVQSLRQVNRINEKGARDFIRHHQGASKTLALLENTAARAETDDTAYLALQVPHLVGAKLASDILEHWQLRRAAEDDSRDNHEIEALLMQKYRFTKHQTEKVVEWNSDTRTQSIHKCLHRPLSPERLDKVLRDNPFLLRECVPFYVCRRIALNTLEWPENDPRFLAATVDNLLCERYYDNRCDMCATFDDIYTSVNSTVRVSREFLYSAITREDAGELMGIHLYHCPRDEENGDMEMDDETRGKDVDYANLWLYWDLGHRYEEGCASYFAELYQEPLPKEFTTTGHREKIHSSVAAHGCSDADQTAAIVKALTSRISVLAGSAGTGKTFTSAIAAHVSGKVGFLTHLLAPTGKAARRIKEVSEFEESFTIHRFVSSFLKQKGTATGGKDDGEGTGFEGPRLLIIDESSMVPMDAMHMLTVALRRAQMDAYLLFVGDPNQLPPISAGKLMLDLMQVFPTTTLTKIYRQEGKKNTIVDNAHLVLQGAKASELETNELFEWHRNFNSDQVIQAIAKEVSKDNYSDQVLVLGAMKRGEMGIVQLNERLQEVFNPSEQLPVAEPHEKTSIRVPVNWKVKSAKSNGEEEKSRDTWDWRIGDQVMSTSNNYEANFMNGETGTLTAIGMYAFVSRPVKKDETPTSEYRQGFRIRRNAVGTGEEPFLNLELDKVRSDLNPAYACTTHKAQGSEAPLVFVVIDPTMNSFKSSMITRQWVYTSITRARGRIVIFATEEHLDKAMATSSRYEERNSLLVQRLRRLLKET